MKEKKKLIALAGVFAALLVIFLGVLIAKYVEKKKLDKEADTQICALCRRDDLKSLTVFGPNEASTKILFDSEQKVSSINNNGNEFPGNMLNLSEVDSFIGQILHFSIDKSFDAPSQDLSAYGLSSPNFRVSAEKKDGSKVELLFGDLVPEKNGIYAMVEGENTVIVAPYTIYKILNVRFETYLNQVILSLERYDVEEISCERASDKDRWVVRPLEDYDNGIFIEPRYRVIYPMDREPRDEMYTLLSTILQFKVSQYVPIAREDMAAYGLDNPEYTITIRLRSGEVITINLSIELGGYYYGTCSGNPYTFRVDVQNLPGLSKKSFELIDSYVIHGYLDDDVSMVQATIKDKSFVLECRMNHDSTFESEDTMLQLDKRNAKVYTSGGDCYGLLLFGSIFNMPVSRVDYDAKPELKNPEATFFVTRTSGETTALALVPLGDNEFYCFINNYYSGFIVDRSVIYKDNGYVMSDFGVWDAYFLAVEAIDNKDKTNIYDRP